MLQKKIYAPVVLKALVGAERALVWYGRSWMPNRLFYMYDMYEIKMKQLMWCGHVQRVAVCRLPKKVLDWVPQGRKRKKCKY